MCKEHNKGTNNANNTDITVKIVDLQQQNVKSQTSTAMSTRKHEQKETIEEINRSESRIFNKKTLHRLMPICVWLPKYSRADFVGDLIAGVSVGLTSIPQVLAYTSLSGLDLQYGLYACFLGSFIYIFFGTSKDVPMGPTAISALLTLQIANSQWQCAILLTFLSGLVEILMGLLRLGFLHDFVSEPVNAGFLSAVSIIIFTSQLRDLLGIEIQMQGNTFVKMFEIIIENLHKIRWTDAIMGITSIVVLTSMKTMTQMNKVKRSDDENTSQTLKTRCLNFFWMLIWFIGTCRYILVICISGSLCYWLKTERNEEIFRMVGYVPEGLPSFSLPPFRIEAIANQTTGAVIQEGLGFGQMVNKLGAGIFIVPLIALLETMAVVQAFGEGKPTYPSQELLVSGICNVANSFVQGLRSNGGIARGAVLNASGVRTQFSNLYIGIIVMFALVYLTAFFQYIPRTVLAAIIITAVLSLIQYRIVKPMWKTKKIDLIPGMGAFIACLVLPLQTGILIGVCINVVIILYQVARPRLRSKKLSTHSTGTHVVDYLMVTPDRCLMFPSAEFVCNSIYKLGVKSSLPIVLDCTHIYGADFTSAKIISRLINDFQLRSQPIFFYNLRPNIAKVFIGVKKDFVVFYDVIKLEEKILEVQNSTTRSKC